MAYDAESELGRLAGRTRRTQKTRVTMSLGGGALAVLVLLAAYFSVGPGKSATQITPAAIKTSPSPVVSASALASSSTIQPLTDPGVTWLSAPAPIADLGLFKLDKLQEIGMDSTQPKYWQIANLANGNKLILVTADCGMGGMCRFYFRQDPKQGHLLLTKHSSEISNDWTNVLDLTKASTDGSTVYSGLTAPDTLQTDITGVTLKKSYSLYGLVSELKSPTKIAVTAYGDIIMTKETGVKETGSANIFTNRSIFLRHADSSVDGYQMVIPFQPDDGISAVTFTNSGKNSSKFDAGSHAGCSALSDYPVISNSTGLKARLKQIGTVTGGDAVYAPISSSDQIMAAAYGNYTTGREGSGLSVDEFAAKQPIFLWQDKLGDYIMFTNADYAPLAECGKPVIYLYPTTPTNISVKVGAKITKSEPAYGMGWQVLAQPSGELLVGGQTYPNLFWEGLGRGEYPAIVSGTVVARAEAESTIAKQLKEQGLNAKETADFLEFWAPKLPNTSYVRLTWLSTAEMNNLAPLSVSPKPDTVIRVFLDFAGLEKPADIVPQEFTAPKRTGFTLVEWGGLLRR